MTNPYKTPEQVRKDMIETVAIINSAIGVHDMIQRDGITPADSRKLESLINDAYTITDRLSQHASDFVLQNTDSVATGGMT